MEQKPVRRLRAPPFSRPWLSDVSSLGRAFVKPAPHGDGGWTFCTQGSGLAPACLLPARTSVSSPGSPQRRRARTDSSLARLNVHVHIFSECTVYSVFTCT